MLKGGRVAPDLFVTGVSGARRIGGEGGVTLPSLLAFEINTSALRHRRVNVNMAQALIQFTRRTLFLSEDLRAKCSRRPCGILSTLSLENEPCGARDHYGSRKVSFGPSHHDAAATVPLTSPDRIFPYLLASAHNESWLCGQTSLENTNR